MIHSETLHTAVDSYLLFYMLVHHWCLFLQQIKDTIKAETQREEHNRLSMFILVLMSHGTRGNVIMDSSNHPVDLIDIQDLLSPKNFPAMKGKPKVMIVQACSGGKSFYFCLS